MLDEGVTSSIMTKGARLGWTGAGRAAVMLHRSHHRMIASVTIKATVSRRRVDPLT
jgi:hypothetical protein